MMKRFVKKLARHWKSTDFFQKMLLVLLTLLAAFMLLPIVFIFNHAFKPINELFLYPPRFFVQHATLENVTNLMFKTQSTAIPFTRYLFNSIIVSAATLIAVILVSSLAAYAFSKHEFPGKKLFFALTIVSLMFAPEAVIIPRYLVVAKLGIMNTYFAHIFPFIAAPVSVFLFKQFVDQIPRDLIEAAKIDGAKEFRIYYGIVLPVCMPAVATIGILTFQGTWSQSETSTLFTQVESLKTLPYYAMTLTNGLANNVVGQGIAAVVTLLMFLPNLIIFLLFQRKVIATMANSGIK
ncbi:carbohydrate ABC transporter permease [Paenibacillus contaminans]|jgi:ABC-type glycerol-3-phosphate transport system permease component|nr:carbohydrate ABC transporter permease [Paenibacillus contaminans]